jgi:hypothetical protein
MKVKKVFGAVMTATLLLAVLSGCSEQSSGDVIGATGVQAGEVCGVQNDVVQTNENGTAQERNDDIRIARRILSAPLWIRPDENNCFRETMIQHIETSRAIKRGERVCETFLTETVIPLLGYGYDNKTFAEIAEETVYSARRISDITAFYCLDAVSVDGFNLVQVGINEHWVLYTFVQGEVPCNDADTVRISIARPELFDETTTQDPLCDIALQIIETAELVVVR